MRSTSKNEPAKKKKAKRKPPPLEIGWREWVSLPDLGVARIKAKIDTGAKSSALHAYQIEEFERDGKLYAAFDVHPVQRKKSPSIRCVAPIVDKRSVKSSNGAIELRIVIATVLTLGPVSREVEITLTNRDEMGFRLLIGRDSISRVAVIYPGKSFLLGK
ncbi:MAG: RimK/LysX family protein [Parvularculaceae bacterium]